MPVNDDTIFGHFTEDELAFIASAKWSGVNTKSIAAKIGRDVTKVRHVAAYMASRNERRPGHVPMTYDAGSYVEGILQQVADHYELDIALLRSPRRDRWISDARQAAMYALREAGLSYPHIARILNRGDHTTIIHGVRAHAERLGLSEAA